MNAGGCIRALAGTHELRQRDRGADNFQGAAGAPRTGRRTDGIGTPAESPILADRALRDERRTEAEPVLRRNAAQGNMHGMIGDQRGDAARRRFEILAVLLERLAFESKLGAQRALVLRQRGGSG